MERNVERTVKALRQLEAHNPDLIEIRFDLMKSTTKISQIRNATDRPLIATNRRKDQAGLFSGTEQDRLATLQQAAVESFDYIDIELKTENVDKIVHRVKQNGSSVIVSYHNERFTPSKNVLTSILAREKRAGADICKIVSTAKSYHDSLRCLEFVSTHALRSRLVCFAMGRLGIPSRVLSPLFGAYFTFASYVSGRESAPGQLTIASMRNLYREFQA
jgi:3-dehydroquinate dehydratase type I